jgi:hypothetical protein
MDRVRQARLDTAEAYPMVEVFSAFELLNMCDAGEDKRSDRSQLLNETKWPSSPPTTAITPP